MFLPFTGDAGKYAAISKNIFQNHEFWNLTIHGAPYLQKPPMMMWLSAAGYFLFGEANNFTTRLFPLLFSLLMLYSIYRLGRLFYSAKTGRIAALFLGTTEIYFLYNADLHTDVILASTITLSIWQLAEFIERKKWWNFVLGFLSIGLAMLTKGPIGIAVPVFAIGTHLLLKRNYKMIFKPVWLLGVFLCLAMISPYLNVLYQNFGWDGPKFYFWTNNAGRITGSYRSNSIDPLFYIYNLLSLTIPWAIFVFAGVISLFSKLIKNKFKSTSESEFYTLGGSIVLLIILSFSKMKSPNYIYPAIPFFTLIAANFFQQLSYKKRTLPKFYPIIHAIINGIIWVVIFIIILYIFPLHNGFAWFLILLFALLSILFYVLQFAPLKKILFTSLLSIIALNYVINIQLFPSLFEYQASLKAAGMYNKQATDDDTFYTYGYAQYEMFFYAKNDGFRIIDKGNDKESAIIEFEDAIKNRGAWFLLNANTYNEIKNSDLNIEKEYEFDHFYLTGVNWQFLNPKTRASSLQKMYLLKTKKD
jgi:4-amino-4-deoxy-L-arabinose transferase-like glycosyltransferase